MQNIVEELVLEVYQNVLKLRWPLDFIKLYKKLLLKNKKSGASLPAPFSAWFLKIKNGTVFY